MIDLTEMEWCDDDGRLTPQVMQHVQRVMRKHAGDRCGFCGAATNDEWRIADSACALPGIVAHQPPISTGVVVVVAGCATCGNTLLFRLDVLLGLDPTI